MDNGVKKILTFILILVLTATCAWFLFSDFLMQMLWQEAVVQPIYEAVAQDDRGNIYFVENDSGVNKLVALDDAGNTLLNETLTAIKQASGWVVEDLFVAANKNIVVAAAKIDRQTEMVLERSLHLLYENGAYVGEIMKIESNQSLYGSKAGIRLFSHISETDTDLLFGVYSDGRIKTYAQEKGTKTLEPVLVRDVEVVAAPERFIVLPEHRLALYVPRSGLHIYEPEAQLPAQISDIGIIPDRMFSGGSNTVYLHDAASGGFFSLTDGMLSTVISGETSLTATGSHSFSDIRMAHMSVNQRVAGFVTEDNGEKLYAGTKIYMNSIQLSSEEADFSSALALIAIFLGVLLITVLIWDAYCRLFKMRASIMVRQSLLIVVGVAAMVYLLTVLLIEPAMENTLKAQYQSRVEAAADVLCATLNNSDTPDAVVAAVGGQADASQNTSPIRFEMYHIENGRVKLFASSDGGARGTDARHMPWHINLEEAALKTRDAGVYAMETSEAQGDRIYVLRALPGDFVLAAVSGTESIALTIAQIVASIVRFLIIAGLVMVLVLLLIEFSTVFRIRKLKKCVDAVSGGNYDVSMQLHSGDEVESLATSFNTMTKLIRSNMDKMNRINQSYYRFVPENMIKLLGVSNVENLDRGASVQARMTVMVARFRFMETGGQKNTGQLFAEINDVMQALTPAVSENGGTVYDLLSDGFNAVFDNDSEEAVRAALKIRSYAATLNQMRKNENKEPVEVYLVLNVGDVMLGVVGDERRLSPTAISDAIVDAQSMIGICPESNIFICCTEELMRGISGYRNRYVGEIEAPSGRCRLYDLYDGDPQPLLKHKSMCEAKFRAAVEAFYARDYKKAKVLFMEIIKLSLADKTSVNYMYFADRYLAQPQSGEAPVYRAMPKRQS